MLEKVGSKRTNHQNANQTVDIDKKINVLLSKSLCKGTKFLLKEKNLRIMKKFRNARAVEKRMIID